MVYVFHSADIKALVRKYWSDGLSQRDIARKVGISRNTVPGIVRRLGLPRRLTDGQPRGWTAHKVAQTKPKAPLAPKAIGPIGDFPAGDACRFIAGEVTADFQCCAQPGFPYCDFHKARVYQKGVAK